MARRQDSEPPADLARDEELLDLRPKWQPPNWLASVAGPLVRAAGAVVAGAVVVFALTVQSGSDHPPVASPAASEQAGQPGPPISSPFPTTLRGQMLLEIYQRAHDPSSAVSFIRSDTSASACQYVPAATSPKARAAAALKRALINFALLDTAQTIDKFGGLCSLEVRAQDSAGTVAVLRITSPVEHQARVTARTDDGAASSAGTTTQFVRVTHREGWAVMVGTSGPTGDEVQRSVLSRLAANRSLLW